MALPPEQINIKRRREEEPVETLYIQSELHQTKRRFTDFVFQRVTISGKDGSRVGGDGDGGQDSGSSSPAIPPPGRVLKTPRSVSSLKVAKGPGSNPFAGLGIGCGNGAAGSAGGAGGVPLVRATSPGAEFREERRLAAARREKEERIKRALHSSAPEHVPAAGPGFGAAPAPVKAGSESPAAASRSGSGRASPASAVSSSEKGGKTGVSASVRRFQISRSVDLRRSVDGGIQKRKGQSGDAVAVLVEKLRRKSHSRKASMVVDHLSQAGDGAKAAAAAAVEEPARPRKRPVVNQAEKKWREERKNAISAAKQNIWHVMDKGEDESERLAKQFEQIALELDGDGDSAVRDTEMNTAPAPKSYPTQPKPPLKYQPRTPTKPRPAETKTLSKPPTEHKTGEAVETDSDSDEDYVYDVYIRKPLPEAGLFSNPLSDLETDQDAWFRQNGIDTTRQDIGVIVITQEDEGYWENFVESDDDEEQWDDEDADSNAENNPANDYPDEELSWDDEDDDPSAVYERYRHHAGSDDEEFDFDDSASEGYGASSRRYGRFGYTQEYSDDEDGY
ncbi:hypothetical protein SI65_08675 [Aspergillus cristatus]|uniref:Transcription factor Iwr1 domain-containing protein n=1 Tax=Aspergillus cristatus TaxID=573508 RepID=A0A1E3B4D8_ASPCR|nr:hypothetical protein SI65_08675 [Aspergillus cristatus]